MVRSRYVKFTYIGPSFEDRPFDSSCIWLYTRFLTAFVLHKLAERSIVPTSYIVNHNCVGKLCISFDFVFHDRARFSDPTYFKFYVYRVPHVIDRSFIDHPSFQKVSGYPSIIPFISTYSKDDLSIIKFLHKL